MNRSNLITKYNDMLYGSRPVKYNEFITNKYNIVHQKLYEDALDKFISDVMNRCISSDFLRELFRMLEDTSNPNIIYEMVKSKDERVKLIGSALEELHIDKKEFITYIVNLTIEKINDFKNDAVDMTSPDKKIISLKNILSLSQITDFIISYKGHTYVLEESGNNDGTFNIIQGSIIASERESNANEEYGIRNDFVFLLEDSSDGSKGRIHVGYTLSGEKLWYIEIDDRPEDEEEGYDLLSSIEKQLTELVDKTAKSLIDTIRDECRHKYKNTHRFFEIKNDEYWKPSSVMIIGVMHPYTKKTIDLDEWWNYYQEKKQQSISKIKLLEDQINDSEVIYINYVTGKAKMRSKLEGIEYDVDFDYLSDETEVADEYTLSDTFSARLKNIYANV